MTFISDTCSPWRRLYAVLSGTRQWMDTRSVITATHSLILFIERRRRRRRWSRRIFTCSMHEHLLNRNNAFLMENSGVSGDTAARRRVCWMSPGVPQFIFEFATYKHVNSLCFEIRQNDSSRQPLKAVNTLTSTFPTWKGCWRYWQKY